MACDKEFCSLPSHLRTFVGLENLVTEREEIALMMLGTDFGETTRVQFINILDQRVAVANITSFSPDAHQERVLVITRNMPPDSQPPTIFMYIVNVNHTTDDLQLHRRINLTDGPVASIEQSVDGSMRLHPMGINQITIENNGSGKERQVINYGSIDINEPIELVSDTVITLQNGPTSKASGLGIKFNAV